MNILGIILGLIFGLPLIYLMSLFLGHITLWLMRGRKIEKELSNMKSPSNELALVGFPVFILVSALFYWSELYFLKGLTIGIVILLGVLRFQKDEKEKREERKKDS